MRTRERETKHLDGLVDHFDTLHLIAPLHNVLALEHVGQLFRGTLKFSLVHIEDIL